MKKILAVIDAQNMFVKRKNKEFNERIIKNIKKAIPKFDEVVFFRYINTKDSGLYRILAWKKAFRGKGIEIVDELKPFAKKVYDRDTFSIFKIKEFVEYAKNKEVWLAGFDSDACVLASAYEAIDLGIKIKISEKLLGAGIQRLHKGAIKIFRRNFRNIWIE